eukprot:TRINITY_DN15085_c0_g1_i1.p1 TRINITY_DN15085_c0_g1~~TRINITY_DN15085_c0_g1_i1.p1  ORF type:complete len:76 (-),score=17.86 TRINITY_DN15085_c0_g1_i1:152-379(-)
MAILNIAFGQYILGLTAPYLAVFWAAFGLIVIFYVYEEIHHRKVARHEESDSKRDSVMNTIHHSGNSYRKLDGGE